MDDFDIEQAKKEMEPWYWWGIPTFFKCPWDEDPNNCDIALVGVPHSSGNGSTERDQHLGPPRGARRFRLVPSRPPEVRFRALEACRIHDLGDVPLPQAMLNDVSMEHIEAYFKQLDRANTRPVSVGGDHAITGPILKAIAGRDARISGGRKAALLHFDAHRTTTSTSPIGSAACARQPIGPPTPWSSSTSIRRRACNWACAAIPSSRAPTSTRASWATGSSRPTSSTRSASSRRSRSFAKGPAIRPLYITFDLDVLDPTGSPRRGQLGAGAPRPQGLGGHGDPAWPAWPRRDRRDIVCMIPSKDTAAKITAMTAMVLMFEVIALIGDSLTAK